MKYELAKFNDILYVDGEHRLRWKKDRRTCKKDSIVGSINSGGYIQVTIQGVNYYAHRIIYLLSFSIESLQSTDMIDHIDRNKENNSPANLRLSTKSTNGMNRGKQANNSSGSKGVSYRKDRSKWLAKITKNGKSCNIGLFDTIEEAASAYSLAATLIHGEYSCLV